jgi:hypothetical protein
MFQSSFITLLSTVCIADTLFHSPEDWEMKHNLELLMVPFKTILLLLGLFIAACQHIITQ